MIDPAHTYPLVEARRLLRVPGRAGDRLDLSTIPAPGALVQFRAPVDSLSQPEPLCFDNRWQPHVDPTLCKAPLSVGTLNLPVVSGARVVGPGLVVTQDDRVLDKSVGRHAERYGLEVTDGRCRLTGGLRTLVEEARVRGRVSGVDGPALYISDPAIHHFGVWMIKCLPRLGVLELIGRTELPLLLPTGVPDKFLRLLAVLGVDERRVRFHDPHGITTVDQLILAPKLYTPASCRYRQPFELFRAGSAMRSTDSRIQQPGLGPARIYVSRRGNARRRLANEKAVEALCARFGFEVIEPSRLTALETMMLFRDCELVAGPLGSGLYNLLLSERAPRALALVPPVLKFERLPATLVHVCAGMGARAGFVHGREVAGSRGADEFDYAWDVDLAAVEAALVRVSADRD